MAVDPALLEDIEFFKLLDDADRRALAEVVDLVKLDDNQTLFQAGELGESLFLVRAGEVELFIKDNTGQKIILDITRAGDFFGEIALLDAGPRTATAEAVRAPASRSAISPKKSPGRVMSRMIFWPALSRT